MLPANPWPIVARLVGHCKTLWLAYNTQSSRHAQLLLEHHQLLRKTIALQNALRHATVLHPRCAVCMDRPATHGYLHGDTVHWAVCDRCANRCVQSAAGETACTTCRQPAALVRIYPAVVSPFASETLM